MSPLPFAWAFLAASAALAPAALSAPLDSRGAFGSDPSVVVVERPNGGASLAETYVVVRPPARHPGAPEVRLFIGIGSVVDEVRLRDGGLDVTYRDHWPVDVPGAPTRQRVRSFPVDPDWVAPAWAIPADIR